MKRMALLLALWFYLSAWPAVTPLAKEPDKRFDTNRNAVFTLPASLKVIEEEAFDGISVEAVIIPDLVEIIGDRAFANNSALRIVKVPASVSYIGDGAFEGSINVTFQGETGSYAAAWAEKHNIAFAQAESALTWLDKLGKLLQGSIFLPFSFTCAIPKTRFRQRRGKRIFEGSMRPQDRIEMYPINYKFP